MISRIIAWTNCIFLGAGVISAQAHPHVFASAKVELVGSPDGKLQALHNIWRMDELFSSTVLVEFDQNKNGVLDDDERVMVGSTVKQSIAEWGFYTVLEADGREVKLAPPDEIRVLWDSGQLLIFFEMNIVEPIEITTQKVTVFNLDESFYVAFDFANLDDVQLLGMPHCAKTMIQPDEDEAVSQYMNSIAALAPDQTVPDDGIDYSKLLATRIEVSFAPSK